MFVVMLVYQERERDIENEKKNRYNSHTQLLYIRNGITIHASRSFASEKDDCIICAKGKDISIPGETKKKYK